MVDIKFSGVSKIYRIRESRHRRRPGRSLANVLAKFRRVTEEFWALRDVSFDVHSGETLGIIGHNGAGKSTIFKLLSKITLPTRGEIRIRGRLSALIEVGSGFHPELTGRENVYLSGSILGMRRREITRKLESIVEFAGVSRFIDTPVKRYSSGMYVRLGFSIAAHLDADILLLDEVLAVGDAAFQEKCLDRVGDLKRAGKTIVFVSHDLHAIERLCDRALLMRSGEIVASGAPRDVIAAYYRVSLPALASSPALADGHGAAQIESVRFFDADGGQPAAFKTREFLGVRVQCDARQSLHGAVVEVVVYSIWGTVVGVLTTAEQFELRPGTTSVEFRCPELTLGAGIYYVDAAIKDAAGPAGADISRHRHCAVLRVDGVGASAGFFHMPHTWSLRARE